MREDYAHALRDIRGLDSAPWWTPTPGWWLMAMVAVLLVAAILWPLLMHLRKRQRCWQHQVGVRLSALSAGLAVDDPKNTAGELSALLRVAAMGRFGRHCCAGLSGDRWLRWLASHAPDGFDWPARGQLLLRLPYARAACAQDRAALATLLQAARRWVKAADEGATENPAARGGPP